jgi:thymidylate synthase
MQNIPVLHVEANTLAEAYEQAVLNLYHNGIQFQTQYDKLGDPPSLDCTMNITVNNPLSDPMIHKAFPGGIEDLREYVMELQGLKDHWTRYIDDPDDKRWEYTYHQRLSKYGYVKRKEISFISVVRDGISINQIDEVIDKLCKQPFTRQAQMITWNPNTDIECYDPPCLQSIWYRILEEDNIWYLNCNVRFRSNDAWGANFMNMFGFTQFNKLLIADEISKRTGKEVRLGRMNWQADSFHIYGKDIQQAKERLINRIDNTSFESRTMNFYDEMIQEIYNEAEAMVIDKIKKYDDEHK